MDKKFESGISDYAHFPLTIDITFPIDRKGNVYICCEYCMLYTGRKCAVTEEVILHPNNYVGYSCPLKKKEEK